MLPPRWNLRRRAPGCGRPSRRCLHEHLHDILLPAFLGGRGWSRLLTLLRLLLLGWGRGGGAAAGRKTTHLLQQSPTGRRAATALKLSLWPELEGHACTARCRWGLPTGQRF